MDEFLFQQFAQDINKLNKKWLNFQLATIYPKIAWPKEANLTAFRPTLISAIWFREN